tara:strand:- start:197 stop:670 length:474 start_codon:yes stop_codon:yes gene_type:complete
LAIIPADSSLYGKTGGVLTTLVSTGATGGAPITGLYTGIKAGTISIAGPSDIVINVLSGILRSLGLTTATESVRGTGPVKVIVGLGLETIDVGQVQASEREKAGTISTAESSTSGENVASDILRSLGLTTAAESAREMGPVKRGLDVFLFSGGGVGE